jgi:hypothetical protein
MSADAVDPRVIQQILEGLLDLFNKLGMSTKGDPTLAEEFRCPNDGSSRTWKLSEQLASRPRGHFFIDGKRTSFVGGNPRLDELDPGSEPQSQHQFFVLGAVLTLAGALIAILAPSASGCYGWTMILLGAIAMLFTWYADHDLVTRHATWTEKKHVADTHWRCEACGCVFLPEERKDLHQATPIENVSAVETEVVVPAKIETHIAEASENVAPLRRPD